MTAGPYKFASYTPNAVTLVVNPYYQGPKPDVATLKFVVISNPATAVAQLESGQIQFADYLPSSVVPQLTEASSPSSGRTSQATSST